MDEIPGLLLFSWCEMDELSATHLLKSAGDGVLFPFRGQTEFWQEAPNGHKGVYTAVFALILRVAPLGEVI